MEDINTYDTVKSRRIDVADVVEQIAVGTELAHDHDRSVPRVLGYTDTKLLDTSERRCSLQITAIRTKRTILG